MANKVQNGAVKTEEKVFIGLRSSDNEIVYCEILVAYCCRLIREMYETLGVTDPSHDVVVPLANVTGKILKKIVEWAEYHKDDTPLTPAEEKAKEKRADDIPAWDIKFFARIEKETLFEIILAANYLDVPGLLNVACKTAANMMIGLTPEQIREKFSITNDFLPGEEDQIRLENEWCEEK